MTPYTNFKWSWRSLDLNDPALLQAHEDKAEISHRTAGSTPSRQGFRQAQQP
jgi:hypothetical protein